MVLFVLQNMYFLFKTRRLKMKTESLSWGKSDRGIELTRRGGLQKEGYTPIPPHGLHALSQRELRLT